MSQSTPSLRFYGGPSVSLLALGTFLVLAIVLAFLQASDIRGMWAAALIGLMVTFFLCRDRKSYPKALIGGMADSNAVVPIVCWIFAGIFGQVLSSSGLVDGILWAAYHVGATGVFFVVVSFVASAAFATATGTSFGTIIAAMAVLYPAGVLLGADPFLLAGAIVGGGAFGDNLAPISDTTIASATSQDASIGGVVKSRIRYVIPATILTLVAIVLLGGGSEASVVPYEQLSGYMNPWGLVMIIPAALTLVLAIRGFHIVSATTIGSVVGLLIAQLFGLNSFANVLFVSEGAAQGILVDGVAGMVDIGIFALLVMACVNIMREGGGDQKLISGTKKLISKPAGAEFSIAGLVLLLSTTTVNALAILATGVSYAKPVGKRFNIHRNRIANILDAFGNTLAFTVPWSPALFLVVALSADANREFGDAVPILTTVQLTPMVIYCWALLAVMIFAVATGWGRRFEGKDGEPLKKPEVVESVHG